jgi:hypothetical protein
VSPYDPSLNVCGGGGGAAVMIRQVRSEL